MMIRTYLVVLALAGGLTTVGGYAADDEHAPMTPRALSRVAAVHPPCPGPRPPPTGVREEVYCRGRRLVGLQAAPSGYACQTTGHCDGHGTCIRPNPLIQSRLSGQTLLHQEPGQPLPRLRRGGVLDG